MSTVGLDAPGIHSDCLGKVEGSTCIAYCATGYSGDGATVMQCAGSGSFEFLQPGATLPTCTPTLCTFQLPDGVGVTSDCEGKGTGESCTAECGSAFEYDDGEGPETFVCRAEGTFEGTSPVCAPRPCEVQAELSEYETGSCAGKTGGGSCAVSCAAGYSGDPAMYSCNGATGAFEPIELPVSCTPAECTSGIPQSADLNTTGIVGLTTGQSGRVACADGFEGEAESWTCNESGTVLGASPMCEPVECDVGTIDDPPGVKHTCDGNTFGDTCSMMCSDGYELAPGAQNEVWECAFDGAAAVFSGTVPNCTAKACDTSSYSDFIGHGCEGITVGGNCSYSCPVGTAAAEGTPAVQNFSCIAAGSGTSLHGTKPQCVPMTCSAANMSTPSNCEGIEVGQSCRAVCLKGFEGNATFECAMDPSNTTAALQGEGLVCVGKPCANASLPVGAQHAHNCSGLTTNETCNVSCAPGHEGESVLVLCDDDGLFQPQGDFPACPAITSTSTVSMTTVSTTKMTVTMTSISGTNTTDTTTSMTDTTATTTNTTMSTLTTTSATMTNTTFSETVTSASTTTMTNTTATETATSVVTSVTVSSVTLTGTDTSISTGTFPAGFMPSVSAKVLMSVQSPSDFIADAAALSGFNSFVAQYLGVTADDLDTALSLLSRRLRSLQDGNVEADVTVSVPPGSSTDQGAVKQKLTDMGDAQSADLAAALEAEGATGYSPEVKGTSDVEGGMVQMATTTTPAPPAPPAPDTGGSDGPTGAVVAIIVVLCILFVAVVAGGAAYLLYKRRGKGANNNNTNAKDTNADNSGEIPEDAMDEHGAGVEVRARQFQVNLPQAEDNARDDAEGVRQR